MPKRKRPIVDQPGDLDLIYFDYCCGCRSDVTLFRWAADLFGKHVRCVKCRPLVRIERPKTKQESVWKWDVQIPRRTG